MTPPCLALPRASDIKAEPHSPALGLGRPWALRSVGVPGCAEYLLDGLRATWSTCACNKNATTSGRPRKPYLPRERTDDVFVDGSNVDTPLMHAHVDMAGGPPSKSLTTRPTGIRTAGRAESVCGTVALRTRFACVAHRLPTPGLRAERCRPRRGDARRSLCVATRTLSIFSTPIKAYLPSLCTADTPLLVGRL